jgi:thiol-disulfide isomerase/thioredoxin
MMASLSVTASAQQEITFVTPDGQSVSLSSLRGKVVVLLFGGVQDPQCRDEFKALESLAERYNGKDVSIYWVSVNSPNEVPNDKLKNPCGPVSSVLVLRDQNQAGFKRFSGRQLPTVVVLNPQGQVHGQPRGGFNPNSDFVNDLAAVIDALLNQK